MDEVKEIIEILSKYKSNICINTVVHKENYSDILNIFSIIINYPYITKWQLFQYMPIGPGGFKNKLKYEVADETYKNVENELKFFTEGNSSVDIQFKSRENRKNQYLLIDGEGVVWIPKQDNNNSWAENDVNNERLILGTIHNKNAAKLVLEKLRELDKREAVTLGGI